MHSDPATNFNPNSSDFPIINPNASIAGIANGCYTIFSTSIYNNFFESPEVPMSILLPLVQINYRIPDDLTRTMISNIATAIDLINGDMVLIEIFLRSDKVGFISYSSKSVGVRVFKKQ